MNLTVCNYEKWLSNLCKMSFSHLMPGLESQRIGIWEENMEVKYWSTGTNKSGSTNWSPQVQTETWVSFCCL